MNDKNNNMGCLYSWPTIILMLICFWPLGLYLIFKRVSMDKTALIKTGGKALSTLGGILVAFGLIMVIAGIASGEVSMVIVFLFFVAGGVALLLKANKTKQEAESVKRYLSIIINGGERELDAIAAVTGKQYEIVRTDIQNMIDKGFLRNGYINEGDRTLVLASKPTVKVNTQTSARATVSATTTAAPQPRVVSCPCCGANNTIMGNLGECEYCGSPLK